MTSTLTQSEVSRRRAALTFCYLCGQTLADGRERTREHVVPRAVLGRPASSAAWALVLDVHADCERHVKRESDALFALWQKLFSPPEERTQQALDALDVLEQAARPVDARSREALALAAVRLAAAHSGADLHATSLALDEYIEVLATVGGVSSRETARAKLYLAALLDPKRHLSLGHYRNTPLKVVEGVALDDSLLPIEGLDDVFAAVWTWVRGLHAAVYEAFLSGETPHAVLTPLRAFSGTDPPRPFPDERVHRTVLAALEAADQAGKLERVEYWDTQCRFRCVWVHTPERGARARCVWGLDVPGPQDTRAWWGWYDLAAPLRGATLLTQSDLDSYNTEERVH